MPDFLPGLNYADVIDGCVHRTGSESWIFFLRMLGMLGTFSGSVGFLPIFSDVHYLQPVLYGERKRRCHPEDTGWANTLH